jgi:Myosin head (motor domain)
LAKGSLKDIQLDDVNDFELTDRAMTRMGINDGEKVAIYAIVAGVLHLGNISFEDDPATKGSPRATSCFGMVLVKAADFGRPTLKYAVFYPILESIIYCTTVAFENWCGLISTFFDK